MSLIVVAGCLRTAEPTDLESLLRFQQLPEGGRPKDRIAFPPIQDWSTLSIKLERTSCYGTCPVYSVEILGDGAITFEGHEYVAVAGRHTARISQSSVRRLFERFRAAEFFWLLDDYAAPVTDLETQRVTVSFDGHSKTVADYWGIAVGMPKAVVELESEIDKVAGTKSWIVGNRNTVPRLRSEGWNFQSTEGANLVASVTRFGPPAVVKDLVLAGSPVNGIAQGIFDEQLTPLGFAAAHGDVDLMRFLFDHGADVNAGGSVLVQAAVSGRPDAVALVLRHRPAIDRERWTAALVNATWEHEPKSPTENRAALVRQFVAAGADVNYVDDDGETLLMRVLSGPIVRALLEAGANPNARDKRGETPLSHVYNPDAAQMLLEAGADPWAKLQSGAFAYEDARNHDREVAVVIDRWLATHPKPTSAQ